MANSNTGNNIVHRGGCYCNRVRYEVTGEPLLSAYCHCTLCQRFNAAAFILTIHFPESNFKWTHSEEDALDSYNVAIKPWKKRWRCKTCGCNIASYNSKAKKWSVWGGQLDRDEDGGIIGFDSIKPSGHIFYSTRMVDVNDELGKWAGYEEESERLGY